MISNISDIFSWLQRNPSFQFELQPRDPMFLPKEFQGAPGDTCYFLEGYKHTGIDQDLPIQKHIDTAMEQINKELN